MTKTATESDVDAALSGALVARPFVVRLRAWGRVPIAIALLLAPATARADEPLPTPIDHLGPHLAGAFSGESLYWYGGAVAGTAILSASGGDHAMRVFVQRNLASTAYGDAMFYTGYILPVVAAPAIWITGALARDPETAGAGAAAIQALATTAALTTTLKVLTGRPYPLNGGDPNAPDRLDHPEFAQTWKPLSLTRVSWPSGHTSGTWSIAAALTAYYPGRWAVPLVAYPIATAIGVGMLAGDRHWASDVLAGALIAQAIGWSIGRAFRIERDAPSASHARVTIVPLDGAVGASVVATGW